MVISESGLQCGVLVKIDCFITEPVKWIILITDLRFSIEGNEHEQVIDIHDG